ncbi:hypothetical protein OQJ19_04005 [Fluoribacter gormanii]|uniref:Uncharacterized protein n=1 Tax=Fluoribacter gormanii TaxID=464 RepID=A0A377GH38_9GAMM|nr:hypothetical protein [Fluoribacter gormanii]KTD05311.1 hypothetical protein Lgor_0431 [Fluoribacter gormanii]MCW8444632.1 hypothetical protein [Fluoribacter gormanii]MCW8469822.1 hypothetical protein [Fluoribacter gormanii]SIR84507.1 hypothetical protein SAMN05421777_12916 [Fluoribacter gormanii]STO23855.1 Uncharacterised protein [Fluoribacter gormanii]
MFKKIAGNESKSVDLIHNNTQGGTSVKNFLEGARKDAKKYELIDTGVPSNPYQFLPPLSRHKNSKAQVPPFIVHGLQIADDEVFEAQSVCP